MSLLPCGRKRLAKPSKKPMFLKRNFWKTSKVIEILLYKSECQRRNHVGGDFYWFLIHFLIFAESPIPINIVLSINHSAFFNGDMTNFDIDSSWGAEASELYPDVKYTTVEEYLDQFVWGIDISCSPVINEINSRIVRNLDVSCRWVFVVVNELSFSVTL